MNYSQLKNEIYKAWNKGTLITKKHNPFNLSNPEKGYRSVLSHDLTSNFTAFLQNEDFQVYRYGNTTPKFSASPENWIIIPNQGTRFENPASGVTAGSTVAHSVDRALWVVSGTSAGLHIHGCDLSRLAQHEANGIMTGKTRVF